MTEHIIPAEAPALGTPNVHSLDRFSRKILFKLLRRLERGLKPRLLVLTAPWTERFIGSACLVLSVFVFLAG